MYCEIQSGLYPYEPSLFEVYLLLTSSYHSYSTHLSFVSTLCKSWNSFSYQFQTAAGFFRRLQKGGIC